MLESGFEANAERSPSPEMEGNSLTVEQAIANLSHDDLSLRYYAAWWLGKFARAQDIAPELKSAAVDALILSLEDDSDRTELGGYPLRRNAARALGKLADSRAVPDLVTCLGCEDFYVREAAAQSLAMLGDGVAIPQLRTLLSGGLAAAQFVPGRPHLTQPYEAVLEALGALGAVEAVEEIRPFLDHPVNRVQYAAARALYQLTKEPAYAERLVQALNGRDVQLRRSALSDLGAIGYLPAAEAIATAAAENSFKFLALKGLLESELGMVPPGTLPESAVRVMTLMDSLL